MVPVLTAQVTHGDPIPSHTHGVGCHGVLPSAAVFPSEAAGHSPPAVRRINGHGNGSLTAQSNTWLQLRYGIGACYITRIGGVRDQQHVCMYDE